MMIVMFWMPVSASSPPPTSSMMIAIAPITMPQKITTQRDGWMEPRCESVPMTIDAASAPDTKKIATRTMASTDTARPAGTTASSPNSCSSVSCEARSVPVRCRLIAAPPKIANQSRLTTLGMRMTPATNWRIVRPRLMRAMNMPTNGVQEIHQAQ